MAEDFKIATAYVQFETKGDVKSDVAAAKEDAKQIDRAEEATHQNRRRRTVEEYSLAEKRRRGEQAKLAIARGSLPGSTSDERYAAAMRNQGESVFKIQRALLQRQRQDDIKNRAPKSTEDYAKEERRARMTATRRAIARGQQDDGSEDDKFAAQLHSQGRSVRRIGEQMQLRQQKRREAEEEQNAKSQADREEQRATQAAKRQATQKLREQKIQEADAERTIEKNKIVDIIAVRNKAQAHSQIAGMAGKALGGLPFAGGASQIAQASIAARQAAQSRAIEQGASKAEAAAMGRIGGLKGGAAAVAVAAVAYGIEGAHKASPQTAERLQYQQDRLQAIVGQHFVQTLNVVANALEKFGNLLGGKGAQLNMPQFSDFASTRDRLQLAALGGMGSQGGEGAGSAGGEGLGSRLRGAADSAGVLWPLAFPYMLWRGFGGRSIMNALE